MLDKLIGCVQHDCDKCREQAAEIASLRANAARMRDAIGGAQQSLGPRRPEGSSNPDSPEYDHDAFLWDHYEAAMKETP